jgi:hypothetical protein
MVHVSWFLIPIFPVKGPQMTEQKLAAIWRTLKLAPGPPPHECASPGNL